MNPEDFLIDISITDFQLSKPSILILFYFLNKASSNVMDSFPEIFYAIFPGK